MHEAVPDLLLVVASFSCKEGVACAQYLHTEQCLMLHSLLLHLVVGRMWLVVNTCTR